MKVSTRGRGQLFCACSILAMAALPPTARAACVPEPTSPSVPTTCSSSDGNGLVVASNDTTVSVLADGSVSNIAAPAILVAIASGSSEPFRKSTINVAGTVDGNGRAGIAVTNGTMASGVYGTIATSVALTVAEGGLITGGNGITIAPTVGNTFGYAQVNLDNAGTITGTNGPALSSTGNFSQFSSIVNQAGGFIGGIAADVSTIGNQGRIDGGGASAINDLSLNTWVINSGSIASTSAASTVNSSQSRIDNSGTVSNYGTGAAIGGLTTTINNFQGGQITAASGDVVSVTSYLTFDNAGTIATTGSGRALNGLVLSGINHEGGTISSGGPTAIYARWSLNIINRGEIVGDVYAGIEASSSSVDSTQGTLRGNLIFGASSDQLYATYTTADGLQTGVTGTIDGGAGTDTLQVRFGSDATVSAPIEMPRNFENLGLVTGEGVTVTLDNGFSAASSLQLSGSGQLVNRAALQTAGTVIGAGFSNGPLPSFRNEGSVVNTGAGETYALALGAINALANSGTITSASNGISASPVSFENSGTIIASGTAANLGVTQKFNNSGTIRSDAGTGAVIFGSSYFGRNSSTNSGTIEGAVAGLNLSAGLVNSGVIRSAGQAVILGAYSRLENASGGMITGGVSAIAAPQSGAYNATVINAGTINGDVSFVGTYPFSGNNRFFAQAGGVLNGNLTLGQGDTLITELSDAGAAQFDGINGTVTATDAALRYVVRADAQALYAPVAGFRSVGYDLYDGATLALSGQGVSGQGLTFAGSGSVTLDLDLQPAGSAITTTSVLDPYAQYVDPGAVSITSNGSITYNRTSSTYASSVVTLGENDTFANAGTIQVTDTLGPNYGSVTAVTGGTVVNSGTIVVSGGVGLSNVRSLTNTGTITASQAAIDTVFDGVVNSGALTSTGGAAIVGFYSGPIVNRAEGTITGNGTAIQVAGAGVINAGTINGTVDLGYSPYGSFWTGSTYVGAGGRVNGDLLFGERDDNLIETGAVLGITGTIDAGDGFDSIGHQREQSGTVTLGRPLLDTFEGEFTVALGQDTVITLAADQRLTADVRVGGNGQIINTVATSGMLTEFGIGVPLDYLDDIGQLTVVNQADIGGGIMLSASSLTNTGTVGSLSLANFALMQGAAGTLTFVNAGALRSQDTVSYYRTAALYGSDLTAATLVNSGSIEGNGLLASLSFDADTPIVAGSFDNSGDIAGSSGVYFDLGHASEATDTALSFAVRNSGTIAASGSSAALAIRAPGGASVSITNSGTIRTTADGYSQTYATWGGVCYDYDDTCYPTVASTNSMATIGTYTNEVSGSLSTSITNEASGLIEAAGGTSTAIRTSGPLALVNAGQIVGNGDYVVTGDDLYAVQNGTTRIAGAVQTFGDNPDSIDNSGSIRGSIDLSSGNDSIRNTGTIAGDIFLGDGDDRFVQTLSAKLTGTVDGGAGTDTMTIDLTGGGRLDGTFYASLTGFENFGLTGSGAISINGALAVPTLLLDAGSTFELTAGSTLQTLGVTALTGGEGTQHLINRGTIVGEVALGDGNDLIENAGVIGAVSLGSGDDTYVDLPGGNTLDHIDGGDGTDLYRVVLAGDRTDLVARSNFEQLAVEGSGRLTLALDQDFQSVTLAGTDLTASLGGFTIGRIDGTAAAERVSLDGNVGVVALGSGNDLVENAGIIGAVSLGSGDDTYVELPGSRVLGYVDGGDGTDLYRVVLAGDLAGLGARSNFEQLAIEGSGRLTLALDQDFQSVALAGTDFTASLGGFTIGRIEGTAAAEKVLLDGNVGVMALGGGNDSLTLAQGTTFTGTVDLGDGDDAFALAAGSTLAGTIAGGAGNDSATLALANAFTLTSGRLTGFEHLQTQGAGALTLANGGFGFDTVVAGSDITVASGASLAAGLLTFGPAARQLTIAGGFAGSVAGGTGVNTIEVSGGDSVAPVAFATISDVEVLRLSAGLATVSGRASLGSVALAGGRLIGLAGSTITAPVITVASGATFGSAGTVNGNVTVAGTLSPGASPGTMTVNGNVALASSSVSVFEIAPTVSDKLVINGSLSIAQGATLQIVAAQAVTPGQSLDLITVSGGITGSYTNIVKPASLFGFVVQRDDTISLLGQFLNDPGYTPQVRGAIDYVNGVLVSGAASDALLAAVPDLVTASGASDQAAFARLTPEAYASATQIAVEQGLELANIGRSDAFAARTNGPGAYTFASALGSTRTLESGTQGASKARTNGYGFLGGIGWGGEAWSLGAFVGYLDSRQTLATLGARTELDAVVAGIHGRWSEGGLGIKATVAYHGGNATTHRALPGGSARGDYDLTGWIADISLDYAAPLGPDWTVRPSLGMTAIRVTRDGVAETGGSAYALDVARDRDHALFVDAGMTFQGGMRKEAALRPYLTLGVRYQVEGRTPHALAALDGGGFGLGAAGASRAPVVASATVGSDLAVSSRLTLFGALSGEAGDADNRASGRVGLRFAF